METVDKIHEICLRIEHLENAGDWLARTLVHSDSAASQTGSLVAVLAEDIRSRLLDLVTALEREIVISQRERLQ